MIDVYDAETLVKAYSLIKKKCDAIDKFINNHALYFGSSGAEYGSLDVFNNIIDLMARKNQLINLKIILDNAISRLSDKDKKILFIKINYNIQMCEICGILELKERTAFRRIEKAFENLADVINNSKYCNKLQNIIDSEMWLRDMKSSIKERRMAYKIKAVGC